MQIFTYKKRDFSNLNIHATRIDNQGLFFLSDIQSQTMQHWVLMGFDWTLGYRTYPEMIDLARKLKAILCIFENGKLLECFDFEEDLVLTYEQEIAVNDPLENAPVWNEGVGGVIEAPEDVVIDEEVILRFTPLPGFIFKGWYDENGGLISTTMEHKFTVKKSETITARSQKSWYNVSCEFDNDMGLVNGLGRYVYGTEVTLTAIGKMGYKFKVWSDGYTEAVRKVTVTENINLEVEFEVNDVVVNAKVYPVGAGSIMNVNNITQEGQMADFLATPTADYIFDEFTYATEEDPTGEETLSSKTNPVKIKLLAGRNITAKGKRTVTPNYSLTAKAVFKAIGSDTYVESTEGGTVTPTSGSYKNGVKVTLTSEVAADTETAGYLFDGYFTGMNDGNNLSYSKTYGITINGNTSVYARFSASEKSGS